MSCCCIICFSSNELLPLKSNKVVVTGTATTYQTDTTLTAAEIQDMKTLATILSKQEITFNICKILCCSCCMNKETYAEFQDARGKMNRQIRVMKIYNTVSAFEFDCRRTRTNGQRA